ncbi:hypothetical protein GCM10022405_18570 [Gibbsiella dentisursi]|uniref:Phage integrase central domain-containing protein n=1 Tax=Gibbsiella dentisursi TaxID=796890 RepID=A0ABP7L1S9_9GAMM
MERRERFQPISLASKDWDIRERLGGMVLSKITTRHVAELLEFWIAQDKKTMAATMRSVLSDIFREAIVESHIETIP